MTSPDLSHQLPVPEPGEAGAENFRPTEAQLGGVVVARFEEEQARSHNTQRQILGYVPSEVAKADESAFMDAAARRNTARLKAEGKSVAPRTF